MLRMIIILLLIMLIMLVMLIMINTARNTHCVFLNVEIQDQPHSFGGSDALSLV